jgi:hypothetical protein
MIRRYGGDIRMAAGPIVFGAAAKFNDWGPYDYHRDYNLTFPVQLIGSIAYGAPRWFGLPTSAIGITATWRSLDEYSPRYDPGIYFPAKGSEWEIRTFLNFAVW